MATQEQIIEHLRKLSQYRERPGCDSDGIPYYVECGNSDDTYEIGTTDGAINLAKELIAALDNGADMPELPIEDEDEDEDEEEAGG